MLPSGPFYIIEANVAKKPSLPIIPLPSEAPQLPTLEPQVAALKDATLGLVEAHDNGDPNKFALHAFGAVNSLLQLSGGNLQKLDEVSLPVEFFHHIPGEVRMAMVGKFMEFVVEEGTKKFKA